MSEVNKALNAVSLEGAFAYKALNYHCIEVYHEVNNTKKTVVKTRIATIHYPTSQDPQIRLQMDHVSVSVLLHLANAVRNREHYDESLQLED